MTRIYPEDVARLDAVRRGLQAIRLDDQTNADALSYLLDQHETAEAWDRVVGSRAGQQSTQTI